MNVSGKLYSCVLNKRLTDWVEEHGLINEAQAGFRRNYSTIDHIFTLLALVQRQLLNHAKLYVAFIDFKKAFDLVDRSCLWAVLFINELAIEIIQNGKHGITLSPELIQILIMLFADDVVLLSYTVIGLQQQLSIVRDTAKKLGLVVNSQKSNVVVFRNGGHIAAREKWFYDGMKLEIVNQYKYLGVIFFYRVNILIRS